MVFAGVIAYKLLEQQGVDFRRRSKGGIVMNTAKKGETKLVAPELAQDAGTSLFIINWVLPLKDVEPHKYLMSLKPVDGRGEIKAIFEEDEILSPKAEETWGSSPITLYTARGARLLGERYKENMVMLKDNDRLQEKVMSLETKIAKEIDKGVDRVAQLEKTKAAATTTTK